MLISGKMITSIGLINFSIISHNYLFFCWEHLISILLAILKYIIELIIVTMMDVHLYPRLIHLNTGCLCPVINITHLYNYKRNAMSNANNGNNNNTNIILFNFICKNWVKMHIYVHTHFLCYQGYRKLSIKYRSNIQYMAFSHLLYY